jgi:hypothetical protein
MSSAALSSKRMSSMLANHHVISSLRFFSTLPLSCNLFPPSASRYCENRELPIRRWRRPLCDGRGDRRSIDTGTSASSSTTKRDFFYGPPSSWDAEYEELIARRNKNIVMHPLGHGQHILPGNFVVKKNQKTGAEKKVMLEHALGYFWAFKVWNYGCVLLITAPAHVQIFEQYMLKTVMCSSLLFDPPHRAAITYSSGTITHRQQANNI